MTFQYGRDLNLSFDRQRGFWHFVLYLEPPGGPMSAINAHQRLQTSVSVFAAEWLDRLAPVEPDAFHVLLAGSGEARKLWDPCVYEDSQSPSAVAGDGCVCWQTFHDPVTMMPVAAHHYRTVTGNHENWQHHTYTLLELPDGEKLDSLIIDNDADQCWVRASSGMLHLMPETRDRGYGWGYSGGGPSQLAALIERIVESGGLTIAAAGSPRQQPGDRALAWARDGARTDGAQEFSLADLKAICG